MYSLPDGNFYTKKLISLKLFQNIICDPRDWTKKENGKSINIEKRIEMINKKYGDTVLRFLQRAYLTIYRTSPDIIHRTIVHCND